MSKANCATATVRQSKKTIEQKKEKEKSYVRHLHAGGKEGFTLAEYYMVSL
jgi:hypothetical protein